MIIQPNVLRRGIEALCENAELDLSAHLGDITLAVYDYASPIGTANSFRAVIDDPKAERTPPHMIHLAMQMFMNRLIFDYGLRVMDKKLLVRSKFNQMLLATVLGEADVALLEARKNEIVGKPGVPAGEKFSVTHYGMRRRLYVHEDFMMPVIQDPLAKIGLSRKYIANFEYCRIRAKNASETFHESLETAVVLCGMHHNIVKAWYEIEREVVPTEVDALIMSISHAVNLVDVEPEGTKRTAVERLHGVCTGSKRMLQKVDRKYYTAIDRLQINLRTKEQGRFIQSSELIPGRERKRSELY